MDGFAQPAGKKLVMCAITPGPLKADLDSRVMTKQSFVQCLGLRCKRSRPRFLPWRKLLSHTPRLYHVEPFIALQLRIPSQRVIPIALFDV